MSLLRVLLLMMACQGAWACRVHVVYSDVAAPPYIVGDGAAIPENPGIAVELLRQAATAAQCDLHLQRLPNRRVLHEMEHGKVDAMLMYSYNEERAVYAAYPMKDGKPDGRFRLAELNYFIYVTDSSNLTWDGKQFDPLPTALGVNAGYSVGIDLRKAGYTVEEARSTEQNLQKLKINRFSAYVMQGGPADLVIETLNMRGVRKLPLPYSGKDYFLPFSKTSYTNTPANAERLWEQIAKVRRANIKELLKKYSD